MKHYFVTRCILRKHTLYVKLNEQDMPVVPLISCSDYKQCAFLQINENEDSSYDFNSKSNANIPKSFEQTLKIIYVYLKTLYSSNCKIIDLKKSIYKKQDPHVEHKYESCYHIIFIGKNAPSPCHATRETYDTSLNQMTRSLEYGRYCQHIVPISRTIMMLFIQWVILHFFSFCSCGIVKDIYL